MQNLLRMLAAESGGFNFDPSEYVNIGIGVVMVLLAGRLMVPLWRGWQDYATTVTARGTLAEERADTARTELNECLVRLSILESEKAALQQTVQDLSSDVEILKDRLRSHDIDPHI